MNRFSSTCSLNIYIKVTMFSKPVVTAVIFSRMDPEGKLVMGFRKASNSVQLQVAILFNYLRY